MIELSDSFTQKSFTIVSNISQREEMLYILLMNYEFKFEKSILKNAKKEDSFTTINRIKMMKVMRENFFFFFASISVFSSRL